MVKRLQVVLDAKELAEIRRVSRQHRMTTAEWVRQALRAARRAAPAPEVARTLSVVREGSSYAFPAPDVDQMLREIERDLRPWLALRGTPATWTADPCAPAVEPGDIEALK